MKDTKKQFFSGNNDVEPTQLPPTLNQPTVPIELEVEKEACREQLESISTVS